MNSQNSNHELDNALATAQKFQTLHEIGMLISSEMELERLLSVTMDKVIKMTGAQRGVIALVDQKNKPDFKTARKTGKIDIDEPNFRISRDIISLVIKTTESIFSKDAAADERFADAHTLFDFQIRSVLCTPVKHMERVAGIIYVDSSEKSGLFDNDTASLLAEFSKQIAIALKNAIILTELRQSHHQLMKELRSQYKFDNIIGTGAKMTEVLELVANVADSDTPVLIQGESGTGKELIARALHYNSNRSGKFIAINCGALPENLVESELFGHEVGAFTGAIKAKRGKFAIAHKGSIFLDEIGELTLQTQVKLLRVLQDGTFSPLGSEEESFSDARVIAATNKDLKKMVDDKNFREDLFFRLNVIPVFIPPLRERKEDILLLMEHLVKKYYKSNSLLKFSRAAEQILLGLNYPGNIRELENIVRRAVTLCKSNVIEPRHLLLNEKTGHDQQDDEHSQSSFIEQRKLAIEKWEYHECVRLLTRTNGGVNEAARLTGMDKGNFSRLLKRLEVKRPPPKAVA